MSELSSSPIHLGHPFQIAVSLQTYSPTTFNLSEPLVVTGVLNPNAINLPTKTDLVDDNNLEKLRKAWESYVLIPHAIDITHDNPDSETLVARAFIKVSTEIGDAKLVAQIQQTRFPIPPDYTISLPRIHKQGRLEIIRNLVPFRETSAMLQRMEETFELPIATVRLASQKLDMPKSRLN